jgi:hypothetical protein
LSYLSFPPGGSNFFVSVGVAFGTWFLALMNFVPISLLVTLEMVKFF